jgi:hypothetical protein
MQSIHRTKRQQGAPSGTVNYRWNYGTRTSQTPDSHAARDQAQGPLQVICCALLHVSRMLRLVGPHKHPFLRQRRSIGRLFRSVVQY